MSKKIIISVIALLLAWTALHLPGVFFGTSNTPLHVSYMTADEQSPINGALHILESKSLLAVRSSTLYYGPLFAVLALPAVMADFAVRMISGAISGVASYKDFVVWNWGGVLVWSRLISVIAGFLGLLGAYMMFMTRTLNPSGKRWIAWASAVLLGFNFLYFEYADVFRHWVFMMAIIIWQGYLLIRTVEKEQPEWLLWAIQAILAIFLFGLSYMGLIYQVMWIPVIFVWIKSKSWIRLKEFVLYVLGVLAGSAVIIWWYPLGFQKFMSLVGFASASTGMSGVLNLTTAAVSKHSFGFYAEVIFNNNFLLIAAGLILLIVLFRKQKIYVRYWFWVLVLPAAANYLTFSVPSHHESRYVLPTVVLGLFVVMALYSWACEKSKEHNVLIRISSFLIGASLVLSCVQIIGWTRMIVAGPPERREILPQIISWQKADPSAKILALKGWPFGWVHTPEAYADYVNTHSKMTSDLWTYMLNTKPPKSVVQINVSYRTDFATATVADMKTFDHIVAHSFGRVDPQVWNGSPNDQFDLKPWTVWEYQKYQDTYAIIK